VRSLAEHIAEGGIRVHVVAPATGRRRSEQRRCVTVHEFGYAPFESARILGYGRSMVADRKLRVGSYALIGPYVVSECLRTVETARRHRLAVLHGHWVLPNGPAVALAARILGIPYVISLHGTDVTLAERRGAYGRVANWVLRGASAVAACSQDLALRAERIGARPESLEVIPYGVDLRIFDAPQTGIEALRAKLRLPPNAQVVLGLGRLVDKKGFSYLIEALPSVLANCPMAVLVIAGEGDARDELATLAMRLGVGDKVKLPGLVNWPDVPKYLSLANVFALPSIHDDTGNVDGLPNTLLEAMAARRPVVATRVGGVPTAITHGETGLLVPERDSAALAMGIAEILTSDDHGERLGQAAHETIRTRYSWHDIATRYEALYRSAVEERRW
jgi:glycosyltransferase involved in cell wall biosynthesis